MDDVNIARVIHVFGVVLWIGGVGFVTTVLLPPCGGRKPRSGGASWFTELRGCERLYATL